MGDDSDLLCSYSTVGYIIKTGSAGGPYWTVTMTVLGFVDDNGAIDRLGDFWTIIKGCRLLDWRDVTVEVGGREGGKRLRGSVECVHR